MERRKTDILERSENYNNLLTAAKTFEITERPSSEEEWEMRLQELAFRKGLERRSTQVVSLNQDEAGKETRQDKKHLWLVDTETGIPIRHLGINKGYIQERGESGSGSNSGSNSDSDSDLTPRTIKYNTADIESALIDEFMDAAIKNIRDQDPETYDTREKALKLLKDPLTLNVKPENVYNKLPLYMRHQWNSSESLYTRALERGYTRGDIKIVRDKRGRIIGQTEAAQGKRKIIGWQKLEDTQD